jgi:hypothetical protein
MITLETFSWEKVREQFHRVLKPKNWISNSTAMPVAKKVESTPVPIIPSDSSMIRFGNNVPIVEEKPKSNLEEYNSKKQTYS